MGDCTTCALADWLKTGSGRLHPTGRGRCTFALDPGPLPPWANDARQMIKRYQDQGYTIWRKPGEYEGCEAHQPATKK